ncbi:unnamed protein product [Pseudo-nitzschia multistriata]|uniref:Tubulin--tyrosine ligase-like protein 9 n=1 Tax=Pseudo-nitzschia multistriata TaxID=183589 RepID=A0A448Z9F3_9STRA|nr:unnamed protein product [Pseudo-nitzschia multistriata]
MEENTLSTMLRSRKSPTHGSASPTDSLCDGMDIEKSSSIARHDKFKRQLFGAHANRKNAFLFASLLIATNFTTFFVVYQWVLRSTTKEISQSCPKDMVGFANWFGNTLDSKRKAAFQDIRIDETSGRHRKFFTPVPPQFRKTFYYDGKKISQPIARALRSRGWVRVDDTDNAHLIYTYYNEADWATELLPWQRFNYIPGLEKWNRKSDFVYYYKQYEEATGKPPSVYVPESYMLTENKKEVEAFRHVLEKGNGKNYPWVHKLSNVNQGKGITIMAPNSPELLTLPDDSIRTIESILANDKKDSSGSEDEDDVEESIIQRYICNEMTWNQRKFDVRMYWFVASLDPLVVLYHDGYVRVGNSAYSETSFTDTTSHLTSHTGLGAEGKADFSQLEETLNKHHKKKQKTRPLFPNGNTPVEHVRNQFKHALGEMIEIMKDESFAVPNLNDEDPDISTENSFQFYCADFILDNDLDVWFIEPQNGCGLDEDYYFRLEMHASLFNGMVDILEEVGQKQENQEPLLPLEKSGNWEIIYADGQVYNYNGYERSANKEGCEVQ